MECYPRLRDRGQITISEEIRNTLGLESGDRVKLTVEKMETPERKPIETDVSERESGKHPGNHGTRDDRWKEMWPSFECSVCNSGQIAISFEPAEGSEGDLIPCCDRCGVPLTDEQIEEHDPTGELIET